MPITPNVIERLVFDLNLAPAVMLDFLVTATKDSPSLTNANPGMPGRKDKEQ